MMSLSYFKQFLRQIYGMDISMYNGSFLNQAIEKRMQETGCPSLESYYDLLKQSNGEGKNFYDSLFIHFSEFFRNPLTFAVLERVTLPELLHQKTAGKQREIRIWSAGCAGGQEAYSIAILLEELMTGSDQKATYRIFATDLDEDLFNEARLGHYPHSALGNVSLKRLQTWFSSRGDGYEVKPDIREHIDFSVFDLLADGHGSPPASIFGDFDLVLCCNLLIYYQPKYQNLILKKLVRSLAGGGYLASDEAEREIIESQGGFCAIIPPSAVFQKKR
jgi:chemotaxis protein methyltransferase CheR